MYHPILCQLIMHHESKALFSSPLRNSRSRRNCRPFRNKCLIDGSVLSQVAVIGGVRNPQGVLRPEVERAINTTLFLNQSFSFPSFTFRPTHLRRIQFLTQCFVRSPDDSHGSSHRSLRRNAWSCAPSRAVILGCHHCPPFTRPCQRHCPRTHTSCCPQQTRPALRKMRCMSSRFAMWKLGGAHLVTRALSGHIPPPML